MKCRLCSQPTVGPDKLCGDCTRALRRARAGSTTVRKPAMSRASRFKATAATVAPRAHALTAAPPPGWRRRIAWAAVGLVAVGIVYLGQREPDRRRAPDAIVVVDRSPMPVAERPGDDAAPVPTPLEEQSSTARVKTALVPAPQAMATLKAAQGPASPAATPASARAKAGTKAATTSTKLDQGSGSPASPYTLAGDAAPGTSDAGTRSETEPSQQLARASVPQSAPPMDDAQVLTSALEKCGGEKFLAGVICEQKVRLRYCDGKWGQVPQCTSRPRAD